jgi:hypothetical protein
VAHNNVALCTAIVLTIGKIIDPLYIFELKKLHFEPAGVGKLSEKHFSRCLPSSAADMLS